MQMNSTSPSPAKSGGEQEHAEKAVHVVVVGDGEAVAVTQSTQKGDDGDDVTDYSGRAQWLRAAVLGATDGLVSVASLMIGIGAVNETSRSMLVSGLAGLVAGACSMAIGEFVSVYAQFDIEAAAARRRRRDAGEKGDNSEEDFLRRLPSPSKAAAASAMAWAARVAAVCAVTTASLAGFGALGAAVGGASPAMSAARVLIGGWAAMAACYGVLRLFATM
uniref:Vacuolar iron transporter n=1 Tax=Leersia perrieri TaxID=77586 RepID=A0A0D9X4H8_9ORYZ